MEEVVLADGGRPLPQAPRVGGGWGQQRGEGADVSAQCGHLGAGCGEGLDEFPVVWGEQSGGRAQKAPEAPGGDCWAVGLDAALVDVAAQQVLAAGVAESLDLVEQRGHGHGGGLGAAAARVLAERVDQTGTVLMARGTWRTGRGVTMSMRRHTPLNPQRHDSNDQARRLHRAYCLTRANSCSGSGSRCAR
ncbi:hypothetical protein [Solihabitans fulvus]|uniref:hypothetical protein n=1 Tax=Solihabitans fulvus TaxID=1892852 RepID=UPI001661EF2A|nr:hypothetical protein [Solihabitans fulvus]